MRVVGLDSQDQSHRCTLWDTGWTRDIGIRMRIELEKHGPEVVDEVFGVDLSRHGGRGENGRSKGGRGAWRRFVKGLQHVNRDCHQVLSPINQVLDCRLVESWTSHRKVVKHVDVYSQELLPGAFWGTCRKTESRAEAKVGTPRQRLATRVEGDE